MNHIILKHRFDFIKRMCLNYRFRLLRFIVFFFILVFVWGCGGTERLLIKYEPKEPPLFQMPPNRTLVLSIHIKGNDSLCWYQIGDFSWVLMRSPTAIVQEAIETELKRMGIAITKDPNKADGHMKVEIRWFGPYGYIPSAGAVILSISLYKNGFSKLIWHDKLEAGVFSREPSITIWGSSREIEKNASKALTEAIRKLSWRPEFIRSFMSLSRLSQNSMDGIE